MIKRILLHNIRSAHNVGSVFRTADGAGVQRIYLSGYTPRPIDRFGRIQPEIEKTSLGASATVSFEDWGEDPITNLHTLKSDGWEIVSVEQDARSVSFYDYTPCDRTLYIFGNEIDGVTKDLLDLSDRVIEIPMMGQKESLNVSVAAGVLLFHR